MKEKTSPGSVTEIMEEQRDGLSGEEARLRARAPRLRAAIDRAAPACHAARLRAPAHCVLGSLTALLEP